MWHSNRITNVLFSIGLFIAGTACAQPDSTPTATDHYRFGTPSQDGIGKFYMGREIAHVMGYRGASWLERPDREAEEATDVLVRELPLTDGSIVADIGAGTGYFSFRIAQRVPQGKVYAVDIQQEMLEIVEQRKTRSGVANVETVRGAEQDPHLPANTIDLVLMVDVYHEFAYPYEMMQAVVRALKPGGRVTLVEYRAEDPTVAIKTLHKMSEAQARAEMEAAGLVWQETISSLPQQHLLVFRKPGGRE